MISPLLISDSLAGHPYPDKELEPPVSDQQRIIALEQQVNELAGHVKALDQWGKLDWTKKGEAKA